jgi:hypothetical protein
MVNLTKNEILNDIKNYESRILLAEKKLYALPAAGFTLKERKKIKNKRRALLSEIDHVRGLISMAEEALNQV